jgi:hypothetical protein
MTFTPLRRTSCLCRSHESAQTPFVVSGRAGDRARWHFEPRRYTYEEAFEILAKDVDGVVISTCARLGANLRNPLNS